MPPRSAAAAFCASRILRNSPYAPTMPRANSTNLAPYLLSAALILLLADTLIVLFMSGAFSQSVCNPRLGQGGRNDRRCSGRHRSGHDRPAPSDVQASDERPGDAEILASLDRTHLAYVITGDERTDRTSRLGLDGLTRFLTYRTSLEPGDPIGVDIETDPLELYSMLYWPISADADPPSREAISRIDTFMKSGGTVLFRHAGRSCRARQRWRCNAGNRTASRDPCRYRHSGAGTGAAGSCAHQGLLHPQ